MIIEISWVFQARNKNPYNPVVKDKQANARFRACCVRDLKNPSCYPACDYNVPLLKVFPENLRICITS